MHTPVWKLFIVYSSSPKLEQLKVCYFFLKKAKACWEKPLFYKIGILFPWIYKPKEKVLWQRPQTIEM